MNIKDYQTLHLQTYMQLKVKEQLVVRKDMGVNEQPIVYVRKDMDEN